MSTKKSYTVTCASAFRDAVTALAEKKGANVADLARSILLTLPREQVERYPDPGEPEKGDREEVILKSGPAEGKPWRRKPRLQLRLPGQYDVTLIRKALAVALHMERGDLAVRLGKPKELMRLDKPPEPPRDMIPKAQAEEEQERLRALIAVLSFQPFPDGVRSKEQALHIMGFPPGSNPDRQQLRAKFRLLASIHHPDGAMGNHERMLQLNEALQLLSRLTLNRL